MGLYKFILSSILAAICLLLLSSSCLAADYTALLKANQGKLAEPQRFVTTTEQAVIYTFGGLSKRAPLEDILNKMAAQHMGGTFFVSERELQRNGDNIRLIQSYGQELAIGIRPAAEATAPEVCGEIERIQTRLKEQYGVESKLVRSLYGNTSDAVREAVSAMGCQLFTQTLNVVQSKHAAVSSVEEVMPQIFGKWTTSLGRGQIVYIRTDFYEHEYMAGAMLMAIKEQKIDNIAYSVWEDTPETNPANDSAYHISGIGAVLQHPELLYQLPVDVESLPEERRPVARERQQVKKELPRLLRDRYIGAPGVNAADRIKDFNISSIKALDKTGVVKTAEPGTIFLTFDDWGTDHSINQLLYVLRKHHVPATFFIITWNMPNHPNLLRAIAAEGHDIASHTNGHKAMLQKLPDGRMGSLQTDAEYAQDVAESYQKLAATVGDVEVAGRPALTRLFRAPTLAISREGLTSIFQAGFEYVVSGYESTEDYGAAGLDNLMAALMAGIYDKDNQVRQGSIIIMHMTDYAKYTARALDILLTRNEERAHDDPQKFKVGRLSDYLHTGYSQALPLAK